MRLIPGCILFFLLSSLTFAQTDKQSDAVIPAPENIRIGVFLDMSGQTMSFGVATDNGIRMAVAEINESGGIEGRKIEIFLGDDQGRPEMAKQIAGKLIAEQRVRVLLGDVPSTNSLAAGPVAQDGKIVMISPASTNRLVTQVGQYIFRACFVDPLQGDAMAKFAYNNLKVRRVAIFGDGDSDYSRSLADNFRNAFGALGGKISSEQKYSQIDATFKQQLRAIRKTRPDALYIPGYYGQAGIIAKQARELGMTFPILGGDGWDSPELWHLGGKKAFGNSYVTNHFVSDNPAAEVKDFVKKYKAIYHSEPDTLAALGYDTVYLLADAFKRARSLDSHSLRDALAETTNLNGVTGRIVRFDGLRNPMKPVIIVKLDPKTSTFVYHATIQP